MNKIIGFFKPGKDEEEMNQLSLFDLGELDAETRIVVQQEDKEFDRNMGEMNTNFVHACKNLQRIHEALRYKRPGFVDYCNSKPGLEKSTAYRMIDVARKFPETGNISIESKEVYYFLASSSTPDEARAEAIERAEAGEAITHTKAREIVAEHKPTPDPVEELEHAMAGALAEEFGLPVEVESAGLAEDDAKDLAELERLENEERADAENDAGLLAEADAPPATADFDFTADTDRELLEALKDMAHDGLPLDSPYVMAMRAELRWRGWQLTHGNQSPAWYLSHSRYGSIPGDDLETVIGAALATWKMEGEHPTARPADPLDALKARLTPIGPTPAEAPLTLSITFYPDPAREPLVSLYRGNERLETLPRDVAERAAAVIEQLAEPVPAIVDEAELPTAAPDWLIADNFTVSNGD